MHLLNAHSLPGALAPRMLALCALALRALVSRALAPCALALRALVARALAPRPLAPRALAPRDFKLSRRGRRDGDFMQGFHASIWLFLVKPPLI
jgi:hypothetical protein